MLLVSGLVLLALGLFCGLALVLTPLGFVEASGIALWILFPLFTVGGYFMAAAPAENRNLAMLSRASGALLLLLALASAVVLVLQGASVIEPRAGTMSLWYVLVVGLVLGASGLAAPARMADT